MTTIPRRLQEIHDLRAHAVSLGDAELVAAATLSIDTYHADPLPRRPTDEQRAAKALQSAAWQLCQDALWGGYLKHAVCRDAPADVIAALSGASSHAERMEIVRAVVSGSEHAAVERMRRAEADAGPTGTGFSLGHHDD